MLNRLTFVYKIFLNKALKQKMYMQQPVGCEDNYEKVCLFTCSLYRLKQAPCWCCWNSKFVNILNDFNLDQTLSDLCVFVKYSPNKLVLVICVDDDSLIASRNVTEIEKLLNYVEKKNKLG